MTGRLVLMGSGETTPTMVTPHQRIAQASGSGEFVILDSPYGFQENADELSAKALEYFGTNVGVDPTVVSLRSAASASALQIERARVAVRDAAWVFAGPGSPTYVLAQWRAAGLDAILRERVERGRTVVLASAAACTAGRRTIPVYEVYKAGFAPYWDDGIDLVGVLGLPAVVVPHFDNAEGGTHDTRFCWLGERRLRQLEEELDDSTWVLGVDEHTALDIDLATRTATIVGRGTVTVRVRGRARTFVPGELALGDLVAAAGDLGARPIPDVATPVPAESSTRGVEVARERFLAALAAGDATAATEVALAAADLAAEGDADARLLLRELVTRLGEVAGTGLVDPRAVVAPHVETLLHVRDRMRQQRQFDEADHIREHLTADGVEVRDTADGATWDLDPG